MNLVVNFEIDFKTRSGGFFVVDIIRAESIDVQGNNLDTGM